VVAQDLRAEAQSLTSEERPRLRARRGDKQTARERELEGGRSTVTAGTDQRVHQASAKTRAPGSGLGASQPKGYFKVASDKEMRYARMKEEEEETARLEAAKREGAREEPPTTNSRMDPGASRPRISRSEDFGGPVITVTYTSDGPEVDVDSAVRVKVRIQDER
jgi:hypothetical protein